MWELFKGVGKAFQVNLVERMPRVCKAVIKAKSGYFNDLFNTFLVTTLFHVLFHSRIIVNSTKLCKKMVKKNRNP
jgi:hypothetical protein